MASRETFRTKEEVARQRGLGGRALYRLVNMDRTEEIYLVTAALCAFGSALAAQLRNS